MEKFYFLLYVSNSVSDPKVLTNYYILAYQTCLILKLSIHTTTNFNIKKILHCQRKKQILLQNCLSKQAHLVSALIGSSSIFRNSTSAPSACTAIFPFWAVAL